MIKKEIEKDIEQLLFDCKVMGIEVMFVSDPTGVHTDLNKIMISTKMSDDTIKNVLYNGIMEYLIGQEEIEINNPGLKYKKYWENISSVEVEANWDLKKEKVKNKYSTQKQHLSDIMQYDDELGLYDIDSLKLGGFTINPPDEWDLETVELEIEDFDYDSTKITIDQLKTLRDYINIIINTDDYFCCKK